jgi:hypothetical protein
MEDMMMAMMMGDMGMGMGGKKSAGGGMDEMMMAMMMGDMNLGGGKSKSKAKGSSMDDMMGFMMGAGAGPMGPMDLGLTSDDSYDSDELN